MILVDTTVIINWFRKQEDPKTKFFDTIVDTTSWGVSILTYHEVLQGAKSDQEFTKLKIYLQSNKVFQLPTSYDFWDMSANIVRLMREKGTTIRHPMGDVLIAATAIHYGLELLHNDKDFDTMDSLIPELKIKQV